MSPFSRSQCTAARAACNLAVFLVAWLRAASPKMTPGCLLSVAVQVKDWFAVWANLKSGRAWWAAWQNS